MTRGQFLRSLFVAAAAPKVLAEVAIERAEKTVPVTAAAGNRLLVHDLQLLTPSFYKDYVAKYGDESFFLWLPVYGPNQPTDEFYFFEKRKDKY